MRRNAMDAKDWISVEDRLPADGWPKLFYDDKTNRFGLMGFKDGKFYRICDDGSKMLMKKDYVTHWFDIPQPPVKKEFLKIK